MSVSVAMCTYNGANYLHDQLRSIASQTLPPAELIICDDGSMDKTIEIIQNFRKQTSIPIYLYQNSTRLGIIKNFQQAISLCNYEYIALSDQDDIWMPDKLNKQIQFLESQKEVQVVFADLLLVDESLKSLNKTLLELYHFTSQRKKQWRKGKAFSLLLKNGNVVSGSTLVFRIGFREKFQPFLSSDYKEWLHDGIIAAIAAKAKCIDFLDEPLVYYRQHSEQATIPYKERKYNNYIERYSVLYDDFRQMGFTKKDLSYLRNMISHLKFRAGLPRQIARRIIKVAAELFSLRYYKYSRSFGLTALHDIVNKTN